MEQAVWVEGRNAATEARAAGRSSARLKPPNLARQRWPTDRQVHRPRQQNSQGQGSACVVADAHRVGICTSKTSKHSPHCTLVRACFSTACSRAPHEGHENWYVDSAIGEKVLSRCLTCEAKDGERMGLRHRASGPGSPPRSDRPVRAGHCAQMRTGRRGDLGEFAGDFVVRGSLRFGFLFLRCCCCCCFRYGRPRKKPFGRKEGQRAPKGSNKLGSSVAQDAYT